MSRITEDLADKLAQDAIRAAEELDDDLLVDQVAQVLGASSPSTEELYRTAVRVRMAEARARRFLDDKIGGKKVKAPLTPGQDAPGTNIGGDH